MKNLCSVCDKQADQACGRCRSVWYCGKDHQKSHWKIHKDDCMVYRIEEDDKIGRYLVATTLIKAGSVIMIDSPIALGPKQVTQPVCLTCFSEVDGSHQCPQCGWPLCGIQCHNSPQHMPECQMSENRKEKIKVNGFGIVNPMYESITPMRCLWLKKHFPARWEALKKMESHIEERKKVEHIENMLKRNFRFIKEYLNNPDITEEDVRLVSGVLDTNGFEIPGPGIVGLYPKASMLEHSCVPNVNRFFNSQLKVVIKAAIDIQPGTHITTSYTETLWNVKDRQYHLQCSKYFSCTCIRCESDTELGTFMASIKCKECKEGYFHAPKTKDDDWKCSSCNIIKSSNDTNKVLVSYGERLSQIGGDIQASEKYLKETSGIFHENHSFRSEVKYGLAQIYGKNSHMLLQSLTADKLERKIQLCNEVMVLADILSPGLSGMRGILMNELQASYVETFRRLHTKFRKGKKGQDLLQKAYHYAEEALKIWPTDSHLQEEVETEAKLRSDFQKIRELGRF